MANGQTPQAPPVEMAMSPAEFAELRASVAAIGTTDVQLGRVLEAMLLHLGHAHDLDPAVEDARLAKEAEDARLAQEAADAKAAEEAAKAAQAAAPAPAEAPSA
jgi:hypothetical protein